MSSNTIFSGNSRYASDFLQVIERAVGIASLPLQQLQNQKARIESEARALDSVNEKFTALATAIDNLQKAVSDNLYTAGVSDESKLRAYLAPQAMPGTYSVEVLSLGARTQTISDATSPAITDPYTQSITASQALTLTVEGVDYALAVSSTSLTALAQAINRADAGVQATVVNLGSVTAPDYRLSVQSTGMAAVSIQLNDGSADLLTTIATGAPVEYKVNGLPSSPIQSDSRTVTLSPGLTVDLLATGTAEIDVEPSSSALEEALNGFVTAYNAAVTELDLHHGEDAGALKGQSLLHTLQRALSSINGYSSSAQDVRTLADLGLDLDSNGMLSFDSSRLAETAVTGLDEILLFLGDTSSSGFLKSASDTLNALMDETGGSIPAAIQSVQEEIETQNDRIAEAERRIELLQESLASRIAAADAVIASLEQQVTFLNGLFEAMRTDRG